MLRISGLRASRFVGRVIPGTFCLALITFVCFRLQLSLIIPGLLYLMVVVAQSIWAGFGSSAVISVIAVVCLEYFFIPPVLEWEINNPEDGVALITYLVTSLVITTLASRVRSEAKTAEQKRRENGLLYDVASQLLSLGPERAAGKESLRIFREVFGLRAVSLFDAGSHVLETEGVSIRNLGEKTREAGFRDLDVDDADNDFCIRCLRTGARCIGAIGFEGHFDDKSIALPLSVLAATAVERMRAFQSAGKAAADVRAEMLRSAILDAFAHEFKTPLAIILAATGGLREKSDGREELEMAEIIENQTMRLNRLTTRLLRIAKLDRDEVKPRLEPASLGGTVSDLVDQFARQMGRRVSTKISDDPAEAMIDAELFGLGFTQLLDNACKYSFPDTPVTVELDVCSAEAQLRVTNEGSPIRPEDEALIFERFYRGADESGPPGAGLGLFVARKIMRAHGGSLELEAHGGSTSVNCFCITLPVIPENRLEHAEEVHQSIDY